VRESGGNRETNSAIVSSKGQDSPVSSWSNCLDSSAPIMAASVIADFGEGKKQSESDGVRAITLERGEIARDSERSRIAGA
jgi:hypothetical protein